MEILCDILESRIEKYDNHADLSPRLAESIAKEFLIVVLNADHMDNFNRIHDIVFGSIKNKNINKFPVIHSGKSLAELISVCRIM